MRRNKIHGFTRTNRLRVDLFSANTPMRKVIFRVFSDRFVVESTRLMYVPSTSQDARLRLDRWKISRVNMKQSQSPGFETGGVCSHRVGIGKWDFPFRSRVPRAVTQRGDRIFQQRFHSFPPVWNMYTRARARVSVLEKLDKIHRTTADKETTFSPNRGGLKLHRRNWTLPTLWRYCRNYRKLNTHTGSQARIHKPTHT